MPQYTVNVSTSFSGREHTSDVWNTDTIIDDRSQLLAWLSPLNPGLRHSDIQEHRADGVGEWFLETEEIRRWYAGSERGEGENAVLFCYGDIGVGKTFISSLVVDRLCDQTSRQTTAVSCFYLDFAARKEQSATNVLGSLLKQVVGGMERIPEEISRAFQQQTTTIGGRRPQLSDIVKMLQLVAFSRRAFMCIDGLDECSGIHRVRILDSFKQILEKSPGTRIFATGRPHIRAEVERRLAGYVKSISITPIRKDITEYLRIKLHEDEKLYAMDESLEADILEKVPENASDIFRLVSLNIEAILREPTIYWRREKLSKMTDGSGWKDAYGATIERIKAQDEGTSGLGMAVLMWLSHAERPLRADELCHALAVELGSEIFNAGNAPSILALVDCCLGLITVDNETSTLRLIHPTLKQHLSTRSDIFNRPHSTIAEICLTYLNSKQVKAIPADHSPDIRDTPFLEYCSLYWGVHAKRDLSDDARSLALRLLKDYDSHISGKMLLKQVKYLDRRGSTSSSGSDPHSNISLPFSGIHCASFFGIRVVVNELMAMGRFVNPRDTRGSSPLAWAARNGHEEVVERLLNDGFQLDEPDYSGLTPLSYAFCGGHERLGEMLLNRGICISFDLPNGHGRRPLSYAAQAGLEGLVKLLLERREVNPDKHDLSGNTPLSFAARSGHDGVVRILLGRGDVNADQPNLDGQTPLWYAASGGHEAVVKTLLGRQDVNPNKPDKDGRTPLMCAASGGHAAVVQILLGREEVNPNKPDNEGQTPLMLATRNGFQELITLLRSHEVETPAQPEAQESPPH